MAKKSSEKYIVVDITSGRVAIEMARYSSLSVAKAKMQSLQKNNPGRVFSIDLGGR